ncbi:hypothetical protein FMM05_03380 [Flavobacterium zepuense]|uniref:Uncharacterized protein n=1 Tax=Flavobacterium zepuense TaxID=2593302 RepID=A0A552V7K3_9FLAO|nr:hypothetical protein [Flavobacterium zepuense]TRW26435.1 hypothetical protein FMM05_03380 [Flavobacterium zepuense]
MITHNKTGAPQWIHNLPVVVWAATLLFGTTLLLILLNAPKDGFIVTHAFTYVAGVIVVNVVVLLFTMAAVLHHKDNNRELVSGIILLLTNIPIAFFYVFLLMHFS